MKKAIFSLCCLLIPAVLSAQLQVSGLHNTSDGTAFVISLPTSDADYSDLSRNPELLKNRITQFSERIIAIPQGGLYRSLPVYCQDTAVLGYIQRAGELIHPLFLMRLDAEEVQQYYEINDDAFLRNENEEEIGFDATADDLPGKRVVNIDGRIIDWLNVKDLLRYSPSYVPPRFRRHSASASVEMDLNESVYWKRGGSSLDRVKMLLDDSFVYAMFSSYSEIRDGLSVLLYFYNQRDFDTSNIYTIEVPIAGGSGHVLLWRGKNRAEIIGSYQHGDFFLELQINKEYLPAEIQQGFVDLGQSNFEISTGFTDGEIFEEFSLGNLPIASLQTEN